MTQSSAGRMSSDRGTQTAQCPWLCALSLLVTVAGCGGESKQPLVVGPVEDAAKSGDPGAKMELARRAGYGAIVLSSFWTPPLTAPVFLVAVGREWAAGSATARKHASLQA